LREKFVPFEVSREDGRSDKQVVFDFVSPYDRGTFFTYDELANALQEGLAVKSSVSRAKIAAAVNNANSMLLRERRRVLRSVRGRGYRLAEASEHVALAAQRRTRAESQISKGLDVVRYTDVSDLTPAQRALHEGQMLIMGGLWTAVRGLTQRQANTETVLQEVLRRVDRLDGGMRPDVDSDSPGSEP